MKPPRLPLPIVFITLTLVALAVLPAWASLRANEIQDEVLSTIEPARDLAVRLGGLHSRQMARFQEYMLTGSARAAGRYADLVAEEDRATTALRELLDPLGLRVRALVLPVTNASQAWQLGHVRALESEATRLAFLEEIGADLQRYEAVVSAGAALVEALNDEVTAARVRIEDARRLQSALTIGLVVLALLGTLALVAVARRMRRLVDESQDRRESAVRTRREVDAILEATADGVLSVDLEGRVFRINSAAGRLLGWSPESARERTLHEVLHGDAFDHGPEGCPVAAAVVAARSVDGEEGVVRVRGTDRTLPVLWSVRPMFDGRERRGAVVTVADLTEIKEAEARLRRAIQAREEVMAVVSHDLRSPLGSVMAATELLLEVPLDEERRRGHLKAIDAAAERMNRLIEDLLDVARIDAGSLSVIRRDVPVSDLLRRALEGAEVEARDRGVVLTRATEVPELEVRVDQVRVQQLLQNLIGNALRHTPRGGRVAVEARLDGEALLLSVEDTGCGIEPEHVDHLFDRFWRSEEHHGGGAGLGLAIVKGIAEAHGGDVEVESAPGEGSTFTARLAHAVPVAPDPVSPASPATPADRTPGSS